MYISKSRLQLSGPLCHSEWPDGKEFTILKCSQSSECQMSVNVEHEFDCSSLHAKGMEYFQICGILSLVILSKNYKVTKLNCGCLLIIVSRKWACEMWRTIVTCGGRVYFVFIHWVWRLLLCSEGIEDVCGDFVTCNEFHTSVNSCGCVCNSCWACSVFILW